MNENTSTERNYSSKRNQGICEYYLDGHSQADTGRKFGISESRVYQILRLENIPPRERAVRRKKLIDTTPISPFHAQVGQDIAFRRNKMNMTPAEFAKAAGMSKEKLRFIEMGAKEAEISDLLRLAKVTGIDIQVLMTPRTIANQSGAA